MMAIISSAIGAFISLGELTGLTSFGWQDNVQELVIIASFNIFFVIFSVALLFLRKWGGYGIIATGSLYAIAFILFFESGVALFKLIPIGVLFFAALFIWRHFDMMH